MSTLIPSPLPNATTTARGAMSAADKTKLDAITGTNTGDVTLGAVGAAPNGNGATLTGQVLTLEPASATQPGVATTGAQEFAGAKTFTGAILNGVTTVAEAVTSLVRAVAATLVLRSSLGAGASDKCVVVGSSETAAGTNATARLFSVRAGIGGTEVESLYVAKQGANGQVGIDCAGTTNAVGLTIYNCGAGDTGIDIVRAGGNACRVGFVAGSAGFVVQATNRGLGFVQNANAYDAASLMAFSVVNATGVASTVAAFNFSGPTNIQAGQALSRWRLGTGSALVEFSGAGRLDQSGTDSSGTPGAATIDKPQGKSAIASGATSVRITNNLVASGDQVHITWHGDHGQIRDWVTTGAGFFDVNLNAAASANTAFCWVVSKRL